MDVEQVNHEASNVPITQLYNPGVIPVSLEDGASRYQYTWRQGRLDALLLNKGSDTLVVSFHGAVNRRTMKLPRFERLKALKETGYTSLLLADPTLFADDNFSLGWYTGWRAVNMHKLIARWIVQIAEQLNIKHVILSGSSGGGFAAMQVSSFIPNSVALSFNAQTEICRYKINGSSFGAQQTYLRHLRPDLWSQMTQDERNEARIDWDAEFDDRVSVVKRYSKPMDNYLLLVENDEEIHYQDHFLPLKRILQEKQTQGRFRCHTYHGGEIHNPPPLAVFQEQLQEAVKWARSLPSIGRSLNNLNETESWFDLMVDRVNRQDPTFDIRLNDKIYFTEFAKSNGIPVAKTIKVLTDFSDKFMLPKMQSMVLKPADASSSQGVLILNKDSNDLYNDLRTGHSFNDKAIQEYYQEFYSRLGQDDPKIIIQERLYDRARFPIPRDFKFYVFGGKVGLVQCIDRNRKPVGVTWFDDKFEQLSNDKISLNPKYQTGVGFAKPQQSDQLIHLAEKIASVIGTPFLRVDLYLTSKGPVCGEVTFTPGGPYYEVTDILSTEMQLRMGEAWSNNEHLDLNDRTLQQ